MVHGGDTLAAILNHSWYPILVLFTQFAEISGLAHLSGDGSWRVTGSCLTFWVKLVQTALPKFS